MLENVKTLLYYAISPGDFIDLEKLCDECSKLCRVPSSNSLNKRIKRDYTNIQTVFNLLERNKFMEMCGKDFFLGGKQPTGFQDTFSTHFICQKFRINPYFATRFNTERKIADFSAYKPRFQHASLDRPGWTNLYEHGECTHAVGAGVEGGGRGRKGEKEGEGEGEGKEVGDANCEHFGL